MSYTYYQWLAAQRRKAKRKELIKEIAGVLKDLAIFYNGRIRRWDIPGCMAEMQNLLCLAFRIVGALVFFAVLIGGLNAIALIL